MKSSLKDALAPIVSVYNLFNFSTTFFKSDFTVLIKRYRILCKLIKWPRFSLPKKFEHLEISIFTGRRKFSFEYVLLMVLLKTVHLHKYAKTVIAKYIYDNAIQLRQGNVFVYLCRQVLSQYAC